MLLLSALFSVVHAQDHVLYCVPVGGSMTIAMHTPCPCSTFKASGPIYSPVPLRKCHLFIESTIHPQILLWHQSVPLYSPLSDMMEMQIIR